MRSATLAWFDVGQGSNALDAVALDEPCVGSPDRVLIRIEHSCVGDGGQERRCADSDRTKRQLARGGAPRVIDGLVAAQGESENPQPSGNGLPVRQCCRVRLAEGGSVEDLRLVGGRVDELEGLLADRAFDGGQPSPVCDRAARTVIAFSPRICVDVRPNSPSGRTSACATTRWPWSKPEMASDAGSSEMLIS